jgi:hypothetical protein
MSKIKRKRKIIGELLTMLGNGNLEVRDDKQHEGKVSIRCD